MADIADAIRGDERGVILAIDVSAGSKRDAFPAGYNEWRRSIQCQIRAPPTGGKANKAIIALIAEVLEIPRIHVHIESGMTSTQKQVRIEGMNEATVIERIRARFPRG